MTEPVEPSCPTEELLATIERLKTSQEDAIAANRSKSEFLANMSHEIRTPMSAIMGYADILLDHLQDPDDRYCVQVMKRNGEYLLELINDILDLSRIEANKFDIDISSCELTHLIADIQSLMEVRASEKRIGFEVRYDSPVPRWIDTDATRLRQVLINLLGNAVKFTKGSDEQEPDANSRPLTESDHASSRSAVASGSDNSQVTLAIRLLQNSSPTLEFSVNDTGIGITDEQRSCLFHPFTQGNTSVSRQYGGSGLGLAISHRLVNLLGGEIEVDSELGKGSTFRILLPVALHEPAEMVQPGLDARDDRRDEQTSAPQKLACRVLVIDDRRDVRHISQHFLEKAGATVLTAEDGEQGIDAVMSGTESGEPFDLILMDMHMPTMDGLQATAKLRSLSVNTPIIALTADAMKGDRERCLAGGCDDYLSKPIDYEILVRKVASHMQVATNS